MKPIIIPFTVLVDANEGHPYTFQGLRDPARDGRPLVVNTQRVTLGQWVDGEYIPKADYSIEGLTDRVLVERKSREDAQSTILGWGRRRERFEHELTVLAQTDHALIIVECSFSEMVLTVESRGKKSARENARCIMGQVPAWMNDYRVPWLFADSRRHAEILAFRFLWRAWRKIRDEAKKTTTTDLHADAGRNSGGVPGDPGWLDGSGSRAESLF